MKKVCIGVFALLLFCALSVPALAEAAVFQTAGDLFLYWEENDAYPDYVSGVWSTDGGMQNLTIGVLNTEEGNAGKEEILALIENDATVSFAYGSNSYNRLTDVMESLQPYFKRDLGLSFAGVDAISGTISLGILEERQNDPATIAMIEEMRQAFGDVFVVEYTGELVHTLVGTTGAAVTYTEPRVFFAIGGIVVLLTMLTAVFVIKKRQMSVLQTSTGETVAANAPLSKREVEHAVKDARIDVPAELDRKIFDTIEKE